MPTLLLLAHCALAGALRLAAMPSLGLSAARAGAPVAAAVAPKSLAIHKGLTTLRNNVGAGPVMTQKPNLQKESAPDDPTAAIGVVSAVRTQKPAQDFADERPSDILKDSAPDDPAAAIGIVSELKANAALFSAFAFGSLNLPGTLVQSESVTTGLTPPTALSTSKPMLDDAGLVKAFVLLDASTLCLMITCVAVSQLLIYRLADGSYGSIKYSAIEGRVDRRDTALGRLFTQYGDDFNVARISFALGLASLLLSVGAKTLAVFDDPIALPVVALIGGCATFIFARYAQSYAYTFKPLNRDVNADGFVDLTDAPSKLPASFSLASVAMTALGAGLAVALTFGGMDRAATVVKASVPPDELSTNSHTATL